MSYRAVCATVVIWLAAIAGAFVAPGVALVVMTLLPLIAAGEAWHPATRAWLRADKPDRFWLRILATVVLVFDAFALLLTVAGVPMGWWS